ncbi:MAG: asparagine--tRNA ligase [Phycisphaerae bacterium]|nr:asparagine--tRNA ligase [Phycisphaerae bacterium]
MPVVRITDALKIPADAVGHEVTVQGWVRTRRDSKAGLSFVALSDGSCFDTIQLVAPAELVNYQSDVLKLTAGCSVEATGTLVQSQGKGQGIEMQVKHLKVHGFVDDPDTYPISAKQHSFEYLREVAHLRSRTNTFGAIGRVRHTLAMAIHRFFHESGFAWIHTPIVTGSDCEGAGQMFRVSTLDLTNLPRTPEGKIDFSQDFFGKESHLTVSGQLNVESWCMALSKVYTFGPTFRAENSNTSRHLAEFWMIEPEIAFADLHADADLAEALLKYMYRALLNERADDMKFFAERIDKDCVPRLEKFVDAKFERITYTEAIELLEKAIAKGHKFEFTPRWGIDMQSEHERYLSEQVFGKPVAVLNYPKDIKAFYMRMNDDEKTVAAMDILAPGIGEIVGGSQREERLDRLDKRLDEMHLNKADYWWYRDLRRYGTVPHAGFGLGFERAVVFATGMQNIRDVIPFPRAPKSCDF